MTSLQARVDLVKSLITSPSTCTPAIVATLNELLLPDASDENQPNGNLARASVKTPLSAQPKTRKVLRTGPKTSQASRREGVKQPRLELSPKEKALLATEVINGTLAALSAPSKSQPVIRRPPSSTNLMKSARKSLRRSSSLPHSPLKSQTLQRVSSSPDVTTRSSSASTTLSGHRAIAECSRIAFTCLRTLQASRTPCIMDLKPFQLENGMTALIGRLVMLGLDDLALKELRILKRRLDIALKTSGNASKKTGLLETSKAINMGSQTLVEIIDFEISPPGGAILALAIATQMHALKLMASSRKPSLFTSVVSKLQAEYPGSPIQLLLKSSKESLSQKGKAAKQLENLSRLILSFTPNISSSEDPVALSPRLNASPEVVLQLQVLGFHSRVLWWELCDHQADIERELLEPFSRCLAGFARRSQSSAVERYESATLAFQAIQNFTAQYHGSVLDKYTSPLTRIYKLLSSLAQDAIRFDDAVKWTEIVEETYNRTGASEIQRWTTAANLLSLKLLISPQDAKVQELLIIIIEALGSSLKGGSLELDELLSEVSKARRAIVTVLCKGRLAPNGKHSSPLSDSAQRMGESLVLLCPRFAVRYLSKPPDPNAAAKVVVRYEQRRQFVAKMASNMIDSALFVIKVFQSESRLTWELMDSTLRDCLALLEGVGVDAAKTPNEPNTAVVASSYFVRISNLYFTQHLNMRRDADGPKDTQHLRLLRRSIECIQTRPIMERQAALINSKLERIADIYKTLGRLDDARNALLALRDGLVDVGVLSAVAAASCSQSLKASWHQNEDASMLARTIGLLLKLDFRLESKLVQFPYSDACWSVEEKGVVLEHSLNVLSKQSRDTLRLQKSIFRELLVLYDPTSFPIRRLRVITYLLRLDPEHRRDLAGDVRNTLTLASLESIVDGSNDKGLYAYLPHLRALASSILELQEDHPRIDLLQPHLVVWHSILDECKDYKSLTAKVDEVYDLTSHLHSIADFLHMKGLGKVRVAVLRIIASINEIPRPDLCPDDPVLSYIALGQQYLELGYSGKAGLSFDRARSHASSNGVTTEALLRVQLSYAEYLLAIGNADKW
jgi:separase